jgi:outer membrane protein assembly factor BamB
MRAVTIALAGLALALGGCDWFGGQRKPPLPGERLPVLAVEQRLEPDERLRDHRVELPEASDLAEWPQPQGAPGAAIGHVRLDGFRIAWRASIGAGNSRSGRVTGTPVVAGGRLYTADGVSRLVAIDVASGNRLWTFDGEPDEDRSGGGAGGGAAVDGERVYFATGYGQLVALEAATGKEVWRFQMTAPARSGPAVAQGRVFATTIDNQTHAIDASTGRRIWQHSGISESAGFIGAASPVVDGTTVLVGYSSGELFALRAESGRVLWSDTLSGVGRTGQVSAMADIRGRPAVDRGRVFVSTQSGRTVAIDLRSGIRVWEQEIGSLGQPWVAGDYVFVMGVDGEIACLQRRDGRAVWVASLGAFADERRKRDRLVWSAPILAGGRVFVANNRGQGVFLDAATGAVADRLSLPGGVEVAPVAASRTIFLVTDDGDVAAIR